MIHFTNVCATCYDIKHFKSKFKSLSIETEGTFTVFKSAKRWFNDY